MRAIGALVLSLIAGADGLQHKLSARLLAGTGSTPSSSSRDASGMLRRDVFKSVSKSLATGAVAGAALFGVSSGALALDPFKQGRPDSSEGLEDTFWTRMGQYCFTVVPTD